jgi:hypothetical protein
MEHLALAWQVFPEQCFLSINFFFTISLFLDFEAMASVPIDERRILIQKFDNM